jgi:hypothetical protein
MEDVPVVVVVTMAAIMAATVVVMTLLLEIATLIVHTIRFVGT